MGGPWQFGDLSYVKNGGQGTRTDIHDMRDRIINGESRRSLILDNAMVTTMARYRGFANDCFEEFTDPPSRDNIKVTLIYGNPGTGKSHYAREHHPDAYWKDQTKWWQFYHGQKTVIWDEFKGNCCTPAEFNLVCDKYPHSVETKNGYRPLLGENVYIITNKLPSTWWSVVKDDVVLDALYRRFHCVLWFVERGKPIKKFNDYYAFQKALTVNDGDPVPIITGWD